MTSPITKGVWISLYKQLKREVAKFPQYNYREFAQRRIRDHFVANRGVADRELLGKLLKEGKEALEIIRRQVALSHLYPHQKTAVEEKLAASKK